MDKITNYIRKSTRQSFQPFEQNSYTKLLEIIRLIKEATSYGNRISDEKYIAFDSFEHLRISSLS